MVAQVNRPVIAWLIYERNTSLGGLGMVHGAYLVEAHREQSLKWVSLLNHGVEGAGATYLKG